MVHIFLFHRDLRIQDNTTLIHQIQITKHPVVPIFIFTPEQIKQKKNKYFSHNSVQFMCESLHELSDNIKKFKSKLHFFYGDNLKVLKAIHKTDPIESIGFNIDYTPYAKARDEKIKIWANANNISCYMKEDYALYDILDGQTNKINQTPYLVYTPFMKHVLNNLDVREVNKFKSWSFTKIKDVNSINYYIDESAIDNFYESNTNINVHGGRSNTLKILTNLNDFKTYTKSRDTLTYKTTFLGPSLHFTTCSIREIYFKIIETLSKSSGLIRELIFRDFYMNIVHNFPRILCGQIKGKNKSYKKEYDKISWSYNKKIFKAWCDGKTGFPVIDAAQRQLNTTGYMHNRCRMITSSFLTKDLQ
jgi:deoxyribodipyrimidine photo-lyase